MKQLHLTIYSSAAVTRTAVVVTFRLHLWYDLSFDMLLRVPAFLVQTLVDRRCGCFQECLLIFLLKAFYIIYQTETVINMQIRTVISNPHNKIWYI